MNHRSHALAAMMILAFGTSGGPCALAADDGAVLPGKAAPPTATIRLPAAPLPAAAEQERICQDRLLRLAAAVRVFRLTHENQSPAKMSELYYAGLIDDLADFVCPASGTKTLTRQSLDANGDYMVVQGKTAAEVCVQEKVPHHGDKPLSVAILAGVDRPAEAQAPAAPPAEAGAEPARQIVLPPPLERPIGADSLKTVVKTVLLSSDKEDLALLCGYVHPDYAARAKEIGDADRLYAAKLDALLAAVEKRFGKDETRDIRQVRDDPRLWHIAVPRRGAAAGGGSLDWSQVDIQEQGDAATATVKGQNIPITLARVNGRWFVVPRINIPPGFETMTADFRKKLSAKLESLTNAVENGQVTRENLKVAFAASLE